MTALSGSQYKPPALPEVVGFVLSPWAKKEDYWNVKFDLTRKIKETFDKNG